MIKIVISFYIQLNELEKRIDTHISASIQTTIPNLYTTKKKNRDNS